MLDTSLGQHYLFVQCRTTIVWLIWNKMWAWPMQENRNIQSLLLLVWTFHCNGWFWRTSCTTCKFNNLWKERSLGTEEQLSLLLNRTNFSFCSCPLEKTDFSVRVYINLKCLNGKETVFSLPLNVNALQVANYIYFSFNISKNCHWWLHTQNTQISFLIKHLCI